MYTSQQFISFLCSIVNKILVCGICKSLHSVFIYTSSQLLELGLYCTTWLPPFGLSSSSTTINAHPLHQNLDELLP